MGERRHTNLQYPLIIGTVRRVAVAKISQQAFVCFPTHALQDDVLLCLGCWTHGCCQRDYTPGAVTLSSLPKNTPAHYTAYCASEPPSVAACQAGASGYSTTDY